MRGEDHLQTCQVMRWRFINCINWGHNSSETIEDSHPCPGWSFYSHTEGVLVGKRGDVMGQVKGSYLANRSTGDLSIQNVARNPGMLRTMSTKDDG